MRQPGGDAALEERVRQVLTNEVAPLLNMDGGDVVVLGVRDGVVQVRFPGLCAACPGTIGTIVFGLEQELRRRVPGVEYLEAVP